MLIHLLVAFELFYSVTCLSCHNCPMQANIFNSILTADTIPGEFNNCSVLSEQMACSILLFWMQNPNQTTVMLASAGDGRDVADEHNLQNTITLKNDGTNIQWTNTLIYVCSTEQCNSPSTLKLLLRSLRSDDDFHALSNLLTMNNQFNGSFCFLFANSTVPCETEMDPSTCKQCTIEEYIQSTPVEICASCVMNDVTENFVTREVKFFMGNRERHDFWMIECQQKDCNAMDTGDSIREKSDIQFNFDLFLNSRGKLKSVASVTLMVLIVMITNIQIFKSLINTAANC